MARVFPTGKCFCACGETTEGTSYFVPGHDKRAEAKVVKEVYGSVVELLAAHGYGPDGRDPRTAIQKGTDATGLKLLEKWIKEDSLRESPFSSPQLHVVLEVLNMKDRGGARQRVKFFHVEFSPKERAFRFEWCESVDGTDAIALPLPLTVPLPDIDWVYLERTGLGGSKQLLRVVRLRGAIADDPVPRFLSFG